MSPAALPTYALAYAVFATCIFSSPASATQDSVAPPRSTTDSLEWANDPRPNGADERYLRYLQLGGVVPHYSWSVRGFSPSEARRLRAKVGTHPWSRSSSFTAGTPRFRVLPLESSMRANSAFPYGSNDGAVWAGRGITASASMGISLDAGPVSLTLAPVAFITQNASFDLLDNGRTGDLRFNDGVLPDKIDRPQRFGDGSYGRVDPGASTLRADIGPLALGVSTANLAWGPLELYPFVLGTNAPGFVHGFAGTSRPLDVWVGTLHGRIIWGRLEQSAHSPVQGEATYVSLAETGTRRFASGLIVVLQPRGARGLELGVARFFHSPWPRSGIPPSYFSKPFENILKNRLKGSPEFSDPATSADNQLISGFVRWAFPAARFEMYAEYGREDHSWDKRDFVQEPDHQRAYGLGFRKTLRLDAARMDGVSVELINFQLPHLARSGRGEGDIYRHDIMRQGHTHRGQLLGADVGSGAAAGSTIRWDSYRSNGSVTFALHRVVRQEQGVFFINGTEVPRASDVQYALEGSRMRRLGRIEMEVGISAIHALNRNFATDQTGVSLLWQARVPLTR